MTKPTPACFPHHNYFILNGNLWPKKEKKKLVNGLVGYIKTEEESGQLSNLYLIRVLRLGINEKDGMNRRNTVRETETNAKCFLFGGETM